MPTKTTTPSTKTSSSSTPSTSSVPVKKVVKKSSDSSTSASTSTPSTSTPSTSTPSKPSTTKTVVKKVVKTQSASQVAQTSSELSINDEFEKVLTALSDMSKQVKDLKAQVKALQKHANKEHKDLEKAAKGKRKKGGNGDKPKRAPSGFAKPTRLSPELCVFLGVDSDTELARTEVTKKITTYVKEHDLQKPENKKIILPDSKLGGLLNVPSSEILTYFNLQRYMKVHFQKAEPKTT